MLAVGRGKKIFTRKGKKEEPAGHIQLVSRPEPPPPGFLIQGKVVVVWRTYFTREIDDMEELRVRSPRFMAAR